MTELLDAINALAAEGETDDDDELARVYDRAEECLAQLRLVKEILEDALAARLPTKGKVLGGAARKPHRASNRVWDDTDKTKFSLLAMGRDRALPDGVPDPATGERHPTWEQAITWVELFYTLKYPKTTPMKELGIDPSAESSMEYGRRTVETIR